MRAAHRGITTVNNSGYHCFVSQYTSSSYIEHHTFTLLRQNQLRTSSIPRNQPQTTTTTTKMSSTNTPIDRAAYVKTTSFSHPPAQITPIILTLCFPQWPDPLRPESSRFRRKGHHRRRFHQGRRHRQRWREGRRTTFQRWCDWQELQPGWRDWRERAECAWWREEVMGLGDAVLLGEDMMLIRRDMNSLDI